MRICIDAGHIPNWRNGIDPKYDEGKMSWALAGLLREELKQFGFEVFFTRTDVSTDFEVFTRGTAAHTLQCDLLISLHSDGITDAAGRPIPTVKGVSVFLSNLRPDSKTLAVKLGTAIAQTMGSTFRGAQTRLYGGTYTPNADYYGIIRGAVGFNGERYAKAAFLIEHGFHTNPEECAWLMQEENLKRLAAAEAKVIAEYYGLQPIISEKPQAGVDWKAKYDALCAALHELVRAG